MPKLPCLDCGIPTQRSRCDSCLKKKLQNNPAFIRTKTTKQRGYDSAWQRIRIEVLNRDKFTCHYCGKHLVGSDATVDHLVPLSKGGELLNKSNLASCCRSCNSKKKNHIR